MPPKKMGRPPADNPKSKTLRIRVDDKTIETLEDCSKAVSYTHLPEMLHSVTNYECYKGLYSAFNSLNLFEIAHSLARQFGPENWTLYRGEHLLNFADNHDVTRIHSILGDKNQLIPLYAVLFCMPGIPCLYYGSEWGADGEKSQDVYKRQVPGVHRGR